MGQPLIHRTQLAASVETGFGVDVDEEAPEAGVLASDFAPSAFGPSALAAPGFAPSGLVPLVALFESPPSDVIEDEATRAESKSGLPVFGTQFTE